MGRREGGATRQTVAAGEGAGQVSPGDFHRRIEILMRMTPEGGGAEGISALSYQAGRDASNGMRTGGLNASAVPYAMRTAFERKRRPRGSISEGWMLDLTNRRCLAILTQCFSGITTLVSLHRLKDAVEADH